MPGKKKRGAQSVASDEIARLLIPQIRFLRAAGVTLETILAIMAQEFRNAPPKTKLGGVDHVSVELANHCGAVIATWKTQPDFLSRNGRPGDLAIGGKMGFAGLVKISAPQVSPSQVRKILLRYGAVRRLSNGRLRLTSKLFNCTHPSGEVIAFEPSVAFLADAAKVLEDHIDTQDSSRRRPVRYWREVEDAHIPRRYLNQFTTFSKRRVMVLMEEIEDWLDQHKVIGKRSNSKGLTRLGIGIFAIAERASQDRSVGPGRSSRALTGLPVLADLRA